MPRQNRVDPAGRLHAVSKRGLLMGNRGCLHDAHGEISRRKPPTDRWICCLTEFKSRKRLLMQPGRYTELFFLDEATALAAGHRPCFECRRAEALAFSQALARSRGVDHLGADAIDQILKPERTRPADHPSLLLTEEQLELLPEGAFISDGGRYFLVTARGLAQWSFGGYLETNASEFASTRHWHLVTPPAVIEALRHGYRPIFHPTAAKATD